MKLKLIEDSWNDYFSKVVPEDASEIQVRETRKAFYAGAVCLYTTIMTSLGPNAEVSESDLNIVGSIQDELRQFLLTCEETSSNFSFLM